MSLWRNPKHKIWVDDGYWYEMGCNANGAEATPSKAENIKVIELGRKAASRWKSLLKRLAENDKFDEAAPEE